MSITNWSFTSVVSYSTSAALFRLTEMGNCQLSINGLNVYSVTNGSGVGIMWMVSGKISIKNSSLKQISSRSSGGFVLSELSSIEIDNVTFNTISTSASYGGCLHTVYNAVESSFTIANTQFYKCRSEQNSGGAIFIDFAPVNLVLSISNSNFQENFAKLSGAAIFLSSTVNFSKTSFIKNCEFSNNVSNDKGTLALALKSSLTLSGLNFTNNTGGLCTMYINHKKENLVQTLTDIKFTGNNSTSHLCIEGRDMQGQVKLTNVTIQGNTGSIGDVSFCTLIANNLKLVANTSPMLMMSVIAEWTDVESADNTSTTSSTVLEIFRDSSFTCTRCTFKNNQGLIGPVRANGSTLLQIFDSSFIANTAVDSGSCIYLVSSRKDNLISNTTFTDNASLGSSCIYSIESDIKLKKILMQRNTSVEQTPGVNLQNSVLEIEDSLFADQEGYSTAFVSLASRSVASAKGSTFRNGIAANGGVFFMITTSSLEATNCNFYNSTTLIGGAIRSEAASIVVLVDSTFYNTNTFAAGSAVFASFSSLAMTNVQITLFTASRAAVYASDMIVVGFQYVTIEDGSATENTAVEMQNVAVFSANHTIIRNNYASSTTAGLSMSVLYNFSPAISVMLNCTFFNNTSEGKTALYVASHTLNIYNSSFIGNKARSGDAGGLYFNCLNSTSCDYSVSGSSFINNTAEKNGGGIYWSFEPVLSNNSYSGNKAAYGADIGSFGVKVIQYPKDSQITLGKDSDVTEESIIYGIASGQRVPNAIVAALIDHYGNIVATDDNSVAQLAALDTSSALVFGDTLVTAKGGVYNFTTTSITAKPGSKVELQINSDALISLVDKGEPFNFNVDLRLCQAGEAQIGTDCVKCSEGTYSLDPSIECKECPAGAKCYGGALMVPKFGYWRSSKATDNFLECLNKYACLGSPKIIPDLTGACSTGYKGNLCHSCDIGYSRSARNECGKCPDEAINVMRMMLFGMCIGSICTILVRSSLKTAYMPMAHSSIYFKILANYAQLVLYTTSLSLDWPVFVLEYFKVQNYPTTAVEQIFSIDCYLSQGSSEDANVLYFQKIVIVSMLPLILGSVAVLYWVFRYYWGKRQKSLLRKELVSTIVVLFFLIHPSLVKEYFSIFKCRNLEGGLYLDVDLSIKCFDKLHLITSLSVALPAIIIWGLGVPGIILSYLFRNRKSLDDITMKCRFGFLYNGFKKSHFYWEFLIIYRKMLIISLVVFMGSGSSASQALTINLALMSMLFMQYKGRPYSSKKLNRMELIAILAASITIYCGLYYVTRTLERWAEILLFVFMILANVYFFSFFFRYFGVSVKDNLLILIPAFRMFKRKKDCFPETPLVRGPFSTNTVRIMNADEKRHSLVAHSDELYIDPDLLYGTKYPEALKPKRMMPGILKNAVDFTMELTSTGRNISFETMSDISLR
mmetsp:Transcript_10898/g.21305  ORF Transcript_10898/g.21305 Transcript_10898/m.21305 type:complete len:1423 (-) Transcript_10898:160-4428(-)